MKLKMNTEYYTNGEIVLRGPGEVEVEDKFGEYLVNTFPKWFSKIAEEKDGESITKAETKEKKLSKRVKKK